MGNPPAQPPSGPAPSCPPAPPAPPCPGNANVVIVSDGSWFSDLAANYTERIIGNQTVHTDGSAREVTHGNKYSYVYGHAQEIHVIEKHEQIVGIETKVNLVGQIELCFVEKTELTAAWMLQHESGKKWHLFAKGRRVIVSGESEKEAQKQQFIGQFKEEYGKLEQTIAHASETATAYKIELQAAESQIGGCDVQSSSLKKQCDVLKWEAGSLTRDVRAKEMVEVSSYKVSASSSAEVKGGSVQLKGSAAKVICLSGKVHCHGTKMIVNK